MNYLEELRLLDILITHADYEEREAKFRAANDEMFEAEWGSWDRKLRKLIHARDDVRRQAIEHYTSE
jgi:hypothetical protein